MCCICVPAAVRHPGTHDLAHLVGSILLPQALLEVGDDALIGTLVVVALHSLDSCLMHCLQKCKGTKPLSA